MITVCYLSRNYPRHLANSLDSSSELSIVNSVAMEIENQNDYLGACKLW